MPDPPPPSPQDAETAAAHEDEPASPPLPGAEAAADRWQPLAREAVTAERIVNWLVAVAVAVVGAAGLALVLLVQRRLDWQFTAWGVAYGFAAVAMIWAAHVLPAIAHRHTHYRLSDVGFEIRRGILWRSRIIVPHARVQHTDVAQGPLQRLFNLGRLIVYTAGTHNSSVELNGLHFQTACQLRDALIRRREESDGV